MIHDQERTENERAGAGAGRPPGGKARGARGHEPKGRQAFTLAPVSVRPGGVSPGLYAEGQDGLVDGPAESANQFDTERMAHEAIRNSGGGAPTADFEEGRPVGRLSSAKRRALRAAGFVMCDGVWWRRSGGPLPEGCSVHPWVR